MTNSLESRIRTRKLINELVDLSGLSGDDLVLFWEIARDEGLRHCPLQEKPNPGIGSLMGGYDVFGGKRRR